MGEISGRPRVNPCRVGEFTLSGLSCRTQFSVSCRAIFRVVLLLRVGFSVPCRVERALRVVSCPVVSGAYSVVSCRVVSEPFCRVCLSFPRRVERIPGHVVLCQQLCPCLPFRVESCRVSSGSCRVWFYLFFCGWHFRVVSAAILKVSCMCKHVVSIPSVLARTHKSSPGHICISARTRVM